jgi:Sulfotransferase family
MGKSGRPLLVHYHVYKNAGTSVEKNLSDSFGHQWAVCEGDRENMLLSNDDVASFAKANPHIRAISSHKARPFPIVEKLRPILFLRHPIDRARSIFYFTKRDPTQIGHTLARDGSFKDYVNWWLDLPNSALQNYQVVYLSQASFRVVDASQAVARPEDLSEARDLLRSLRFFGLVRRFEESCRGFEACYRRTFPRLQMRPIHENASTSETLRESDALKIAREELGEATYTRLVEANRFDLALYETAVELFDRNLARVLERRVERASRALGDLFQGVRTARPRPALVLARRRAN